MPPLTKKWSFTMFWPVLFCWKALKALTIEVLFQMGGLKLMSKAVSTYYAQDLKGSHEVVASSHTLKLLSSPHGATFSSTELHKPIASMASASTVTQGDWWASIWVSTPSRTRPAGRHGNSSSRGWAESRRVRTKKPRWKWFQGVYDSAQKRFVAHGHTPTHTYTHTHTHPHAPHTYTPSRTKSDSFCHLRPHYTPSWASMRSTHKPGHTPQVEGEPIQSQLHLYTSAIVTQQQQQQQQQTNTSKAKSN